MPGTGSRGAIGRSATLHPTETLSCTTASRRAADLIEHEVLREADLVAREPTHATEAVAADLLRIARPVDALVADGREEIRLQREGEHVVDATHARQILDRVDDRAAETATTRVA